MVRNEKIFKVFIVGPRKTSNTPLGGISFNPEAIIQTNLLEVEKKKKLSIVTRLCKIAISTALLLVRVMEISRF